MEARAGLVRSQLESVKELRGTPEDDAIPVKFILTVLQAAEEEVMGQCPLTNANDGNTSTSELLDTVRHALVDLDGLTALVTALETITRSGERFVSGPCASVADMLATAATVVDLAEHFSVALQDRLLSVMNTVRSLAKTRSEFRWFTIHLMDFMVILLQKVSHSRQRALFAANNCGLFFWLNDIVSLRQNTMVESQATGPLFWPARAGLLLSKIPSLYMLAHIDGQTTWEDEQNSRKAMAAFNDEPLFENMAFPVLEFLERANPTLQCGALNAMICFFMFGGAQRLVAVCTNERKDGNFSDNEIVSLGVRMKVMDFLQESLPTLSEGPRHIAADLTKLLSNPWGLARGDLSSL